MFKERFEKYFSKSEGCWEWTGGTTRGGYGVLMGPDGRMGRANRLAYELYKEAIPDGLLVLHVCDNPACVNPDHLFLGTHKENTRDMLEKGRGGHHKLKFKGTSNPNSKLSSRDIWEIQYLSTVGIKQKDLANMYNVHRTTIKRACSVEVSHD